MEKNMESKVETGSRDLGYYETLTSECVGILF